jgi:predicted kinase
MSRCVCLLALTVPCELVRGRVAARPAANDATAGVSLIVLRESDPGLLDVRRYLPVGVARRSWVPETRQMIRSESSSVGIIRSKTEYGQGREP